MSIPTIQRAIVSDKAGGVEVLDYRDDYPVPTPLEGQILVKNSISTVNFSDTFFRSGRYPSSKPEILGREAAGTIVVVGAGAEKFNHKIGDRVIWLGTSGYAEYTAAPADKAITLPDELSLEDAAASFFNGLIAIVVLHEVHRVKNGDWALVHAAASSVGQIMLQLLKILGAKVIATAGGPEKVAVARSLGPDHVIDYLSEEGKDWIGIVKSITNNAGVELVIDSVGKDTCQGDMDVVKKKGTIVWIGNASGAIPPVSPHAMAMKSIKVTRPLLAIHIEKREEFEYFAGKLFQYLVSGQLKPATYKVFTLEGVVQAHEELEARKKIGKSLLKLSAD